MLDDKPADDLLTPELKAKILEPSGALKDELRRSAETSVAFYEKLAAASAGSIALVMSVGMANLQKHDSRQFSHSLLFLASCFWLSLAAAIAHNVLFLWSSKLDARYAGLVFIEQTIATVMQGISLSPEVDRNQWKQVEGFAREDALRQQRGTYGRKRRCESIAKVVGDVSVALFFLGFTLVVVGAWILWW